MAIIGEIRNRAGIFILIFVGISLIAFLLMDYSSANMGTVPGGLSAGNVNGQDINIQTYEQRVNDAFDNFRFSNNNATLDEAASQNLRNQTWNSYVAEIVANGEYDKLGIQLTNDEKYEMLMGAEPHQGIRTSAIFQNPETGQFDPGRLAQYVENLDVDDEYGAASEKRRRWDLFTESMYRGALDDKYKALVKKGMYIPDFLANNDHAGNNAQVSFNYVSLPYADIPETDLNISDEDLKTYLNNNKSEFEEAETRNISYVTFPLIASKEDTNSIRAAVRDLKNDFQTEQNDTQFVQLYSEDPFVPTYATRAQLTGPRADRIFNAAPGTVVGPYFEGGKFKLAKVLAKTNVPDSVDCRHILIRPETVGGPARANQIVDSLINVLKAGGDFDFLAADFSNDDSNKDNGGNLGYAKPGQMVPTFNDMIFYKANVGEFNKVVTQFGYHIVEVLAKAGGTPAVATTYVTRLVEPGNATEKSIYQSSSEFAGKNRNYDAFIAAAKEQDLVDNTANGLQINDYNIPGLGASREMVKWAYSASAGDVSEVFSVGNNYVVAALTSVKPKGSYSVDAFRDDLTQAVTREKQGAALIDKMSGAGNNLNQFAKKVGGTLETADNVSLRSGFIPGAGSEPAVVGRAFSMNKGDVSEPIKGNGGVYVIKVVEKTDAPAASNLGTTKNLMKTTANSQVDASLLNALRESVEVEDQRHRFY